MNDYKNDGYRANPEKDGPTRTSAAGTEDTAKEQTVKTDDGAPREEINAASGSYTYYYHTGDSTGASPPPIPPQPPKKSRGGLRIWLAVGLVAAGLIGFFGSWLARRAALQIALPAATESISSAGSAFSTGFTDESVTTEAPAVTDVPAPEETASPLQIAEEGGETLDARGIAAKNLDSVVEIQTQIVTASYWGGASVSESAGSGVILTSGGYIVTNHHVIEDASTIAVRLNNKEIYTAALIGSDPESDLAVLKIDTEGLTPATFGDSDTLVPGDYVVAIGNPLGTLGGTVTDGIISAVGREMTVGDTTRVLLQTNAAINPGNSGGGLFNDRGELIGIVEAKTVGTELEGLGYAIPSNIVKGIVEELMEKGYISGRIRPGFTFLDITTSQMARLYRVNQTGVYVFDLDEGSDAARAGFEIADCITAVDGVAVFTGDEVTGILNSHSPGDVLVFSVIRGIQSGTITMTLTEYRYTPAFSQIPR